MDTTHTYALIAAIAIWWITIATINALKGKWWMALVFNGPIAIITAIRVAKPGFWWDRNEATPEHRAKSIARFPKHTNQGPANPHPTVESREAAPTSQSHYG